jgi:hypothetical protein
VICSYLLKPGRMVVSKLTRWLGPGLLVRRHFHLLAHNQFLVVSNQTRVHGDVVFTRHQQLLWLREKVAVQPDSEVVAPSRKTFKLKATVIVRATIGYQSRIIDSR